MIRSTVTLKFRGAGTQSLWQTRLDAFCRELVEQGLAAQATAHVVFPG